jgi:hypothetical protein
MKRLPHAVALLFLVWSAGVSLAAPAPPERTPAQAMQPLPLLFAPNLGQAPPGVEFVGAGPAGAARLRRDAVELRLPSGEQRGGAVAALAFRFPGGSAAELVGEEQLPTRLSYFLGDDPARWQTRVPSFARVRYRELWPGVDLLVYGRDGLLEYDFALAPGADPEQIRFAVEGGDGAAIDSAGELVVSAGPVRVVQHRPLVYQEVDGQRVTVAGAFAERGPGLYGFRLGPYDRGRELVVDPVLEYSTYLGGDEDPIRYEWVTAVAVDSQRNLYATGFTSALDFPVVRQIPGAQVYDPQAHFIDAFVAKLDISGNFYEYCSFLGGAGLDYGYGIAVDDTGRAYVAGQASARFPIVAAPSFQAGGAFLTVVSATGDELLFSTTFGGSGTTVAFGVAVDPDHYAYVAGYTNSDDFPVQSAYQWTRAGNADAFVVKFAPLDSLLVYGTYLGGAGTDWARGVAVDDIGRAYAVGFTYSTDFPVAGPIPGQGALHAGNQDGFVTRLSAGGGTLSYSTYLGGTDTAQEEVTGVAVGSDFSAYVTGMTRATDFPTTAGARQTVHGGVSDAFLSKLSPTARASSTPPSTAAAPPSTATRWRSTGAATRPSSARPSPPTSRSTWRSNPASVARAGPGATPSSAVSTPPAAPSCSPLTSAPAARTQGSASLQTSSAGSTWAA